ncbi:MAG: arsenite methyltransferase [Acidobacteria bacterium]|nr:arsenite methyltransferase [Acidobacteriota bacterium]
METEKVSIEPESIKKVVKEKYGAIARGEVKGCCSTSNAASDTLYNVGTVARGYKQSELAEIPSGANLGLGCGDPTADADIQPGHTVLDLGSGAGIDCFLAARRVGAQGRVIGVDMTDAMLEKARANAREGGFSNVEFRKGEIEKLPVESATIDRIISNCVINLAPDKRPVFAEAYRVLKPGGVLSISDIVSFGSVPQSVRRDAELWAGCIAGTMDKADYLALIRETGFKQVTVRKEVVYDAARGPDYGFASVTVWATK